MPKVVLTILFCLSFAFSVNAAVVINEIMYRQSQNGINNDEFIELYNNGNTAIDIGSWVLTDREARGLFYTFPEDTVLGAKQYAVIWIGRKNTVNDAPLADFQGWNRSNHRLNNSGDDVLLIDSADNNIDYVSWGSGSGVDPVPSDLVWSNSYNNNLRPADRRQSISLVPNGEDSDSSACWELTTDSTPINPQPCPTYVASVDTDAVFRGTPGRSNNLSADIVVTKSDGAAHYIPGQAATYQLVVSNNGPDNVSGVVLEDVLPSGVSFNGAVSCTPATACTLPATNPPVGQSLSVVMDISKDSIVTLNVSVNYSANPNDY